MESSGGEAQNSLAEQRSVAKTEGGGWSRVQRYPLLQSVYAHETRLAPSAATELSMCKDFESQILPKHFGAPSQTEGGDVIFLTEYTGRLKSYEEWNDLEGWGWGRP